MQMTNGYFIYLWLIVLAKCILTTATDHFKCSNLCIGCQGISANCSNAPNLKLPVSGLSPKFHYFYFNKIGLKIITDDTFKGYLNMTTVSLSDNSISTISKNAFKNNILLSRISLDGNMLSSLPGDVFRYNVKLESINLAKNSLQRIEVDHFKYLTSLTAIFLNNNRLTFIDDEAFANLNKLTRLFLENNQLKTPKREWLAHFDHVDDPQYEVYFDNNPWSCDCNMRSFIHWANQTSQKWFTEDNNIAGVAFPSCDQPESWKGQRWKDLMKKSFVCHALQVVTVPEPIELDYGNYLNISCNGTGLPVPTATITKDGEVKAFSSKGRASFNKSATTSDSGEYKCTLVGTTSHGKEVEKSYAIKVVVHSPSVSFLVITIVLGVIAITLMVGMWIYKKKFSKTAAYNSLPDNAVYYDGGHADQEQSSTLLSSSLGDTMNQETNEDVLYGNDSEKEVLV